TRDRARHARGLPRGGGGVPASAAGRRRAVPQADARLGAKRKMAKNGFKIFDADTHVGPDATTLERYLSAAEKARLDLLAAYRLIDKRSGHVEYTLGRRGYPRKLGAAEPTPPTKGEKNKAVRKFSEDLPREQCEVDPHERIKDMD